MPRRKPRQLAQKVRIESAAAEQVVEPVAAPQVAEAPVVQPEAAAPRTELAKVDLPAVVEPLRNMTTTVKPANLTVCRVVHVVPLVTCASAASAVVATVMSVTRRNPRCR
jgi:hypothetical protein